MPDVDDYAVLAGFASHHSGVILSGHNDSALLVCDATRVLKVKLQRLRKTDGNRADTGNQSVTAAPTKTATDECQTDAMPIRTAANDRADKSETILLADPWNSSHFALRVNDVVYSKGDFPVVLSAGDAIQLCQPGSFSDRLTFFVRQTDTMNARTRGAQVDAKEKATCASASSHDSPLRSSEPIEAPISNVCATAEAQQLCEMPQVDSDRDQCHSCATQTEWTRMVQEGYAMHNSTHLTQALQEWTSYYAFYYGGPRSLPISGDYVGLALHTDGNELHATVDEIVLQSRQKERNGVSASAKHVPSLCRTHRHNDKGATAPTTAWTQLVESMNRPLTTS